MFVVSESEASGKEESEDRREGTMGVSGRWRGIVSSL